MPRELCPELLEVGVFDQVINQSINRVRTYLGDDASLSLDDSDQRWPTSARTIFKGRTDATVLLIVEDDEGTVGIALE